jgi:hypothetical protein
MHLVESDDNGPSNQDEQEQEFKTVQQALDLLSSLRPQVVEVLRSNNNAKKLRVTLNTMGILKPDKKNETANVLWIGQESAHSSEKTALEQVAGAHNQALKRYSNKAHY